MKPELIGGIRVVVGDEVLDTSVRARLEQMKTALTAERRQEKTMQLNPAEISELIKSRIEGLQGSTNIKNQGTVVSVTDGICACTACRTRCRARCSNSRPARTASRPTAWR